MGESALLVSFGSQISEEANSRVHSLAAQLRTQGIRGIIDFVPAYSSLLIRFDPLALSEEALREHILSSVILDKIGARLPARRHVVPVKYGGEAGPDLTSLAGEANLTVEEAIRLHSGRDYKVYFLGFMPGFAYMGAVPTEIALPRLASPRVRIPAGSVGVAAHQTGVYPFDSPGGWRLIGRTALKVWDTGRRDPALFAAGDYVRFVESAAVESEPDIAAQVLPVFARPAFAVASAGALTTIQDMGRPGYGSVGLCQGGAMDQASVMRANALVGNAPDVSVLELTWNGPTLRALRTVAIALDGADFGCVVDSVRVPTGLSWLVRAGSTVRFEQSGPSRGKARAYLAVSGGFDVPEALGSRSTYLPAGFGGYSGRALQSGDVLGVGSFGHLPAMVAGRFWPDNRTPSTASPVILRFTRYSGPGSAGAASCNGLIESRWSVSARSDRMGARLLPSEGISLAGGSGDVVSFGVVQGTIQLPPDGNPVILGADHQTTGGYPVIGVIVETDWPIIAQLCPGGSVGFAEITVGEARRLVIDRKAELEAGLARLAIAR